MLPSPSELNLGVTEWRPWQPEVIEWLKEVYEGGTKVAVLNAPPGVGKSIVAIGFSRYMDFSEVTLTSTLQLQDQYSAIPGVVDMRGRANFPCPLLGAGYTAEDGICTIGEPCEYRDPDPLNGGAIVCPYYNRKAQARNAREVVSGYQYYLRDALGSRVLSGRDLLVADEAHQIEDELRKWRQVDVSSRARKLLGVREVDAGSSGWLEALREMASEWLRRHDDTRRYWTQSSREARRDYKSIERLGRELGPVAGDLGGWVWESDPDAGQLLYRPVRVSESFLALAQSGKHLLLMSATISRLDLEELGVEDYAYLELASPFPSYNRPILYQPVIRVRQKLSNEELTKWTAKLDEILEVHSSEKGLIHTGNYRMAQYYLGHSRFGRRLMSHTAHSRGTVLEAFKASSQPVVLVSPSMTTGVDLPYDYTRFQVVAKVSWPDRGDPQVAARLALPGGEAWYANKAISGLVQAYGRGVRAEDDAAVFYIIDSTYALLRYKWGRLFPRWFMEAIV